METQAIIIERTFNVDAATVWRALTDKSYMKVWYFDLPEFKPEPGFEFQFTAGKPGEEYVHLCKVVEVVPGRKIAYTWRYEGEEGNSLVTFELFEEAGKTRLRLTHDGLETFPSDNPDLARENFATGWTQIIGTSLKSFLEGSRATT